jgi:hypothetical protein
MLKGKIVSQQVQMLLERMDMHPKEFARAGHLGIGSMSKWGYILESGEFNLLEKTLLRHKFRQLRRKVTQQEIMSIILTGRIDIEEEDKLAPVFSTTGRFGPFGSRMKTMVDISEDAEGNITEHVTHRKI